MRFLVLISLLSVVLAGCASVPVSKESGPIIDLMAVSFTPDDITIGVGDTVMFKVVEASHTIDFGEGTGSVAGVSKAHSGNLDPGDEYRVKFTQPGTYTYFCQYHSSLSGGERVGMVGTITVE